MTVWNEDRIVSEFIGKFDIAAQDIQKYDLTQNPRVGKLERQVWDKVIYNYVNRN